MLLDAVCPNTFVARHLSVKKTHCKKFVFSYTKRSVMFSFKRVLPSALHIFGVVLHKKEMLP